MRCGWGGGGGGEWREGGRVHMGRRREERVELGSVTQKGVQEEWKMKCACTGVDERRYIAIYSLTDVDGSLLLISCQHPHLDVSLPQSLNGLRYTLHVWDTTTHTCRQ